MLSSACWSCKKLRLCCCLMFCVAFLFLWSCRQAPKGQVIVYTSLDQVFSGPILKRFESEPGITVKALYDTEAAKTVGLVNRLIAEKERPQADVFWSSEIARTLVLKKKGVLAPYVSPQAAGIQLVVKDILPNSTSPDECVAKAFALMDALYSALGERVPN
jgi:ABC-type thiamine transport system substrate-binding protein